MHLQGANHEDPSQDKLLANVHLQAPDNIYRQDQDDNVCSDIGNPKNDDGRAVVNAVA